MVEKHAFVVVRRCGRYLVDVDDLKGVLNYLTVKVYFPLLTILDLELKVIKATLV